MQELSKYEPIGHINDTCAFWYRDALSLRIPCRNAERIEYNHKSASRKNIVHRSPWKPYETSFSALICDGISERGRRDTDLRVSRVICYNEPLKGRNAIEKIEPLSRILSKVDSCEEIYPSGALIALFSWVQG